MERVVVASGEYDRLSYPTPRCFTNPFFHERSPDLTGRVAVKEVLVEIAGVVVDRLRHFFLLLELCPLRGIHLRVPEAVPAELARESPNPKGHQVRRL